MCGTKTCEKCRFLMRKGTKIALKPRATLWLFCEVFSLHLIGINRVLKRDFISLIIQYVILDKGSLWAGYWGCWRDLIAMHHFGRTDGLFSGYKGIEIVHLLRGQCFGDCYKQQTYVTAVAIFKIALVVIFWIEKEVLFLLLFKLLLSFYKQYIVCYL